MQLTYRQESDYLIPNLTIPNDQPAVPGKYASMRKRYLQNHRPAFYTSLKMACELNAHLKVTQQSALETMERLVVKMAEQQGVDEQLKTTDQMRWVGMMNNIKNSAEEMVLTDLIYS